MSDRRHLAAILTLLVNRPTEPLLVGRKITLCELSFVILVEILAVIVVDSLERLPPLCPKRGEIRFRQVERLHIYAELSERRAAVVFVPPD